MRITEKNKRVHGIKFHVSKEVTALDFFGDSRTIDSTKGRWKQTDFPTQNGGEGKSPWVGGGGAAKATISFVTDIQITALKST